MGLGGYILWTPVAREYHKKYGRRIYFTNRVFGRLKYPRKLINSDLFLNNPYVLTGKGFGNFDVNEIQMDNRKANYWKKVTKDKIFYKEGGHAIEIACRAYGIENPEIKSEIFLTREDLEAEQGFLNELGPYITIEPHTKDSFTVNKNYGFNLWQKIVNWLKCSGKRVVQVGERDKPVLDEVVDATGRYTIRKTASIIKHSSLFVGSEGGLMHLANGVGTKAVIVYGGYVSPDLTGYKENINLFSDIDCAPCGLRRYCLFENRKCMMMITPEQVYESVMKMMYL